MEIGVAVSLPVGDDGVSKGLDSGEAVLDVDDDEESGILMTSRVDAEETDGRRDERGRFVARVETVGSPGWVRPMEMVDLSFGDWWFRFGSCWE